MSHRLGTFIFVCLASVPGLLFQTCDPANAATALYEAEAATLSGGATIVGAADGSDRTVGDLGGEASGRQAVTLVNVGDSLAFKVLSPQSGANGFVMRYSIPDAPAGGGQTGTLLLTATSAKGAPRFQATLHLTSRYAWLYGGPLDGTRLYNSPSFAATYAKGTTGTHLYDEIQLKLTKPLQSGDVLTLSKTANSNVTGITIDFIELEGVPPPLLQPAGFLSITNPSCGAIALDVNSTGQVFDGVDDSSYASVFNAVIGTNPFNPTNSAGVQTAGTQEKDYYSNSPTDALQDTVASSASAGLSMFALADRNFQSLATCISLVTASGGSYRGVWIPPGRFYIRGSLALPSNTNIQGAGIWSSKFVAVDTAPPVPVTNPRTGLGGIASTSGNFRFANIGGGSSNVTLANFSMFGNVTQRDSVDQVLPMAVFGQFASSKFSQLWMEHYAQGIFMNQSSTTNTLHTLRVRNTLAGGIILAGSTSNSAVTNSQSRSTGDDGFALWSQLTPALATGDSITNSVARLQWFGNGFALYGGGNNSLGGNSAYDTLNFPGLDIATTFVPTTLPATDSMSAISVFDMNFYRCGGDGFNSPAGAIQLGMMAENIDGVVLRNINIQSPTNFGIGVTLKSSSFPPPPPGTITNVAFDNVQIDFAPVCAQVFKSVTGNMQLNDVCSRQLATWGAAGTCAVTNQSATAFQIDPNRCKRPTHTLF